MAAVPEVLVIGAGMAGLTTAIVLAESGLRVVVRAREMPQQTHSIAAAAIWAPYLAAHTSLARWGRETLLVLRNLARQPGTGLQVVRGIEAVPADHRRMPIPTWVAELEGQPCAAEDLPAGYGAGWRFEVPIADMPVYLRYLTVRLADAGVTIDVGTVDSLSAAADQASVIVNCSGLGARQLADDADVVPVRGQIVVVENPGIDCYFGEHSDADREHTYIIPHGDYVVLGGTAELGRDDTRPDPVAAKAIVRRCTAVEPRLGKARVVSHRVGIRPVRSTVRLEHDPAGAGNVIHNYGHGGSGFSTVWGCAYEVTGLVHGMLGR